MQDSLAPAVPEVKQRMSLMWCLRVLRTLRLVIEIDDMCGDINAKVCSPVHQPLLAHSMCAIIVALEAC